MLSVTTFGVKYSDQIELILAQLAIKTVNTVNSGMFGNFSTLTYEVDIPAGRTVETRKSLLQSIKEQLPFAKCLCEYGNWDRIYILFPRNKQLL